MTIKESALLVQPNDKAFDDSPDAGHKDCICSRCSAQIQPGEFPIRMFTTNSKGKVDKNSKEYRFCEKCMTGTAYFFCQTDWDFGCGKCKEQCKECTGKKADF